MCQAHNTHKKLLNIKLQNPHPRLVSDEDATIQVESKVTAIAGHCKKLNADSSNVGISIMGYCIMN